MDVSRVLVKKWLEQKPSSPGVDSPSGNGHSTRVDEVVVDSAHHGFLTDLFHSCLNLLASLNNSLRRTPQVKRQHRYKARDVYYKLSLVRDAFAGGKLESCLSADSDLHQQATMVLYNMGRAIKKGEKPFAPLHSY